MWRKLRDAFESSQALGRSVWRDSRGAVWLVTLAAAGEVLQAFTSFDGYSSWRIARLALCVFGLAYAATKLIKRTSSRPRRWNITAVGGLLLAVVATYFAVDRLQVKADHVKEGSIDLAFFFGPTVIGQAQDHGQIHLGSAVSMTAQAAAPSGDSGEAVVPPAAPVQKVPSGDGGAQGPDAPPVGAIAMLAPDGTGSCPIESGYEARFENGTMICRKVSTEPGETGTTEDADGQGSEDPSSTGGASVPERKTGTTDTATAVQPTPGPGSNEPSAGGATGAVGNDGSLNGGSTATGATPPTGTTSPVHGTTAGATGAGEGTVAPVDGGTGQTGTP